jgi:hypothetical protein
MISLLWEFENIEYGGGIGEELEWWEFVSTWIVSEGSGEAEVMSSSFSAISSVDDLDLITLLPTFEENFQIL